MSSTAVMGLAGLGFCCWAVSLGGLAAMQDKCGDGVYGFGSYSGTNCDKAFRWEWFIICMNFVVVLAVLAAAAMGALNKARVALVGLVAMVTLLYYTLSDRYLNASEISGLGGDLEDAVKTMVAGCIMVSTVNSLLVVALGMSDEAPAAAVEGKQAAAV